MSRLDLSAFCHFQELKVLILTTCLALLPCLFCITLNLSNQYVGNHKYSLLHFIYFGMIYTVCNGK
uniref:Uncharacterized protein n=1 Tax=Anguilla anguilla TaxID=7936 RepID=A0A0E9QZG8_ANGAN